MKIKKTIATILACVMFCGCSAGGPNQAANIQSGDVSNTLEATTTLQSVRTTPEDSSSESQSVQSSTEPAVEPSDVALYENEINFTPILDEDDIEYMGIPYKNLTPEQFIQLWAQSTRECNVQRLFVITCWDGSEKESTEISMAQCLKERKKEAETELLRQLIGNMNFCCHDVELMEDPEAPEGYYSTEHPEGTKYVITLRAVSYNSGSVGLDEKCTRWITLKKIDGYWKLCYPMNSSPNFLGPYSQLNA